MSNDEKVEQSSVDITDEAGEVVHPVEGLSEDHVADLQQKLEEALAKSDEHYDQLLRNKAELDNLRKRSQRELENAHKYAVEKFVNALIPVIDSLELGQQAAQTATDIEKLKEGMDLTTTMFYQLLEKFEIESINPQGDNFDPEFHQAMSIQESADVPPNSVMAVMQKGYTLGGRLIRPAMVMVSKAPAEPAAEDTEKDTE
ncbi:MAG: nucleotide exchange factor GrpE [Gammaproteobacteria bacterium]|nr:nucleotide exchange factor GrpE [Gammaproteobacteria bacterium]